MSLDYLHMLAKIKQEIPYFLYANNNPMTTNYVTTIEQLVPRLERTTYINTTNDNQIFT